MAYSLTRILPVLVLIATPAFAGAYDIPSFSGAPLPPSPSSASPLDKPIESLAADPHAVLVIDKEIPGLLDDPHYPAFKSMSLRTVAAMSSGRISRATLSEIGLELGRRVAKK